MNELKLVFEERHTHTHYHYDFKTEELSKLETNHRDIAIEILKAKGYKLISEDVNMTEGTVEEDKISIDGIETDDKNVPSPEEAEKTLSKLIDVIEKLFE